MAEGRDLIEVPTAPDNLEGSSHAAAIVSDDAGAAIARPPIWRDWRFDAGVTTLIGIGVCTIALYLSDVWLSRGLFAGGVLVIIRAILTAFWHTPPSTSRLRITGSLTRRMILIAAAWILVLLAGGGFALDGVLRVALTRNFDEQQENVLFSLITSAEIGPQGEVILNRQPADQLFLEPGSGLYWQISAPGHDPFFSRSLWDRTLAYGGAHYDLQTHFYDSDQFPK